MRRLVRWTLNAITFAWVGACGPICESWAKGEPVFMRHTDAGLSNGQTVHGLLFTVTEFYTPEGPVLFYRVSAWGAAVAISLMVVLIARALAMGRRSREALLRARLGLCQACGYDLAGNVSGVCPECGAEIQKSAAGFSN